jgi:acyl carrier protein
MTPLQAMDHDNAPPQALLRELRDYIETTFLPVRQGRRIDDHDDLMETGVLDSLAFIELVAEVERRYGMAVRDVDVTQDNFGSLHAIARYVHRTVPR